MTALQKMVYSLVVFLLVGVSAASGLTVTADTVQIPDVCNTTTISIILREAPGGLSGSNVSISLADPAVAEFIAVMYPDWMALNESGPLPADTVSISGLDLQDRVKPGDTNVSLGTVTVRGDAVGISAVTVSINRIDDDSGGAVDPTPVDGSVTIGVLPDAEFSAAPQSGTAPLTVQFTDQSTGNVTAWYWDFGDGTTSVEQNPGHTYAAAGTYTVSLNVTNPVGSDTATKVDLVSVASASSASGGGSSGHSAGGSSPAATPASSGEPANALGVSASGLMTRAVQVISADNLVTLQVDQGVRAVDAGGAPLSEITVARVDPADVPALPAGAAILVADCVYRFGPAGATFDPAVLLTFAVPEDAWEEYSGNGTVFAVKWYDQINKTWEDLPTSLDEETRTVSVRISHFSIYALFSEPQPPLSTDVGVAAAAGDVPDSNSQGLPVMQIFTGLFLFLVMIGGAYLYMKKSRP